MTEASEQIDPNRNVSGNQEGELIKFGTVVSNAVVIGFAARQFIRRAGNDFCKELGKWTPANGEADYDQNLENCSDMAHYLGLDMFPAKNKKIFEAALKNIIRDRIVSAEFALY